MGHNTFTERAATTGSYVVGDFSIPVSGFEGDVS
jgi:hypothetical protein